MTAEATHPLVKLLEMVPEFREDYETAMHGVVEDLATSVREAAEARRDDGHVTRALAFIEQLADSADDQHRSLAEVSFLEAALWDQLGVSDRFGPATRQLWEHLWEMP